MFRPTESETKRRRWPYALGGALLLAAVVFGWPRQEGDPTFDATVADPAYTRAHPRVYFDEGHWNVHKAEGRYAPFSHLVRNDGYSVEPQSGALSKKALAGYDVLVIANALGPGGAVQQLANGLRLEGSFDLTGSAFREAEIGAVQEWVREGGSILLIADHAPAGKAAAPLSAAFGVKMTNGYAEDEDNHDPETDHWGFLVFSRENGLLLDHPITQGRCDRERLSRVLTFTGQALAPPPGSTPFLQLSPEARQYPRRRSPDGAYISAANLAQGVALEYGRGRVVVLGEAAMLTSQVGRSTGREFRFGMSRAGCDNRQLTLNILHWLTRLGRSNPCHRVTSTPRQKATIPLMFDAASLGSG